MSRKIDLTGMKFGKLTVLEEIHERNRTGMIKWKCLCECGNITEVFGNSLRRQYTNSCGKCVVNSYYEKDGYMVGVTTKGDEFYFDKEDFEIVSPYQWYVNNLGYVAARVKDRVLTLHRLIVPWADKIDHVNRIKKDNRLENLRNVTNAQNCMNMSKRITPTSSKYKGVTWYKSLNKWAARICINYRSKHLGYYNTEEEAALAYNKAASFYFGEYANLNVIQTEYRAGLPREAAHKKELIGSLI